jgi:hypothetical protein
MTHSDAAKRARFAKLDRELAWLQAQHDLAMSAFKFDEASALQRRIAAGETERQALAATLPAPSADPEPASGIVPMLARPARRRARRP